MITRTLLMAVDRNDADDPDDLPQSGDANMQPLSDINRSSWRIFRSLVTIGREKPDVANRNAVVRAHSLFGRAGASPGAAPTVSRGACPLFRGLTPSRYVYRTDIRTPGVRARPPNGLPAPRRRPTGESRYVATRDRRRCAFFFGSLVSILQFHNRINQSSSVAVIS
jgi:hypothetical protein